MTQTAGPPVSEGQLAPMLERWFGELAPPRAIAVRCFGDWEGPAALSHREHTVAIRHCASDLAAREALLDAKPDEFLVMLVEFDELSSDLAADLRSPTVQRLNAWDSVLAKFGVRNVDRLLTRETWLADALLEAGGPTASFRRGVSRQLDRERAWQTYFQQRLRLDAAAGLPGLLEWTLTPAAKEFATRKPAEIAGASAELIRRIPGAAPIAELSGLGKPELAAPLGLATRAIIDAEASDERGGARALLLAQIPGWEFNEEQARLWTTAAEEFTRELLTRDPVAATRLIAHGDRLAADINASTLIGTSPVLRGGLRARVASLSHAIAAWRAGSGSLAAVSSAAELVRDHALDDETPLATMAARLVRWLARSHSEATTLQEAAQRYAEHGSYADLARVALRQRTGTSALEDEVDALLQLADERRREEDQQFAQLLGQQQAQPSSSGTLLGVEDLLSGIVAPIASQQPVLVVVLDGLSHRVVSGLAPSLAARGWSELRRTGHPERALVLSALPSVTEFSRASLLSGTLTQGKAASEAAAFAGSDALRGADPQGLPPLLVHKATLADERGLAADVRDEIAGDRRVVGVVINAVDDHLDRSEQIAIDWSLDTLVPLGALLDIARDAGRIVVIASDHGHVLDRRAPGPAAAPGESGQRWRAAGGSLADGEIEISGPRVLRSDHRCVLAWDETVRYSARKHGYHGGANPQEVLAPLLVLSAGGEPVEGWAEANDLPPSWWTASPEPVVPISVPASAPTAESAARETKSSFEPEPAPPASDEAQLSLVDAVAGNAQDWVAELLASDVYAQQRELAGRGALDDDRLGLLLRTLDANNATLLLPSLAQATGWPLGRLPGLLAAASRMLNVEGYPVLSVDQGAATVTLDLATLRRQFELS